MEMKIAGIIHNYSLVDFNKERGVVYVPVAAFEKEGVTLHDLMLGFSLLSKHGVHNHEQCKGQMELMSGENVWHFQEVAETDIASWEKSGDVEMLNSIETAWCISIDPKKIAAFVKKPKRTDEQTQQTDKTILYFKNDGELFRNEKQRRPLKKDGMQFRIFRYLSENPNTDYEITTEDMATALGIKAPQLRNEMGKLKRGVEGSLALKGTFALIETKRFNGYRLNPRIEIIETN